MLPLSPCGRTRLGLVIGLLLSGAAHGAVLQWNDPSGGSFSDATNWTPARAPAGDDTVRFNLGATPGKFYVVTGMQGGIDRLVVGQDSVRFDFDGVNRLKLSSGDPVAPSLVIGEIAGQSGLLQLVDGGTLFAQDAVLGMAAGSRGELQVDGATFEASGTLFVGRDGVGQVTVTNAGEVASRTMTVGNGAVNVQGGRLKVAGEFVLGNQAQAALDVTQGGEVTSGDARIDAFAGGITGASLIGAGSRWDVRGRLTVGGVGFGLLSLERGAVVASIATELDGPSAVGINSSIAVFDAGSRWENRESVDIGVSGTAAFGASRGGVATARRARLGVNAGSFGVATLRDAGSRWDVEDTLDVGLLGRAALRVRAGAVVTARTLTVGSAGTVTVADKDSLLDIAGDAGLAGFVDLDAGGVVDIGGALRVIDNGRIDADGAGTILRVGKQLSIGTSGSGAADVDLGTGTLLDVVGSTTIFSGGRLHLDGGALRTASLSNAGRFDFTTGLVDLTGGDLVIGAGAGVPGWFESTLTLGPQQRLSASRGAIEIDQGGDVRVDGASAALNTGSFLQLGRNGHGSLTIVNGANVGNADLAAIGNIAGSSGEVTVRGAISSWNSVGDIVVGNFGTGTLDVLDGGYVKSASLFVGGNTGSTGRARVAGNNSKIDVGAKLLVGLANSGTLEIADGGKVDVIGSGDIGIQATADGVVNVSGAGSLLSLDGPLTIGKEGKGELTVADGGRVENTLGTIGAQAKSRGDVYVRGADSTWDNSSNLFIGDFGAGALTIEDGGKVLNFGAAIGNEAGGAGEVVVRGAGSRWTNRQVLLVGDLGTGSLRIEDGATVSNASFGFVGNIAGSSGDVTVTGAGSLWDSGGTMIIGNVGKGALDVLAGARVEAPRLVVGDGVQGRALVHGAGSAIASDQDVVIGEGSTGELAVRAGGLLVAGRDLLLGELASGNGELIVDGAGSRVEVARDFTVGVLGSGNAILTGGANLAVDGNGEIAGEAGSRGRVSLRGNGTHWENALDVAVGLRGEGELEVATGATLATQANGLIGHQSGASGRALIRGAGSEWTIGSTLYLGYLGDGELVVANGAKVAAQGNGLIANLAGSSGLALISGTGAEWTLGASLFVGDAGDGWLTVTNGATVTTQFNGQIGFHVGATGSALVTGAGSEWKLGGTLFIGNAGVGELSVANGAQVITENKSDSWVGFAEGSSGTFEITGADTRATTDQFVVGYQGDGTLSVLDGAVMTSTDSWIGYDSTSDSSARVSGGAQWLTPRLLLVGGFGSGRLDIVDGGFVHTGLTYVASGINGRGTALVEGADSAWITNGDFYLGGDETSIKGEGDVTVRDGGNIEVDGVLRVFDHSRFHLEGGTLRVGQLDLRGAFEFDSGTLALTASDLRIGGDHGIPGLFEHSLLLAGNQHVEVVNGTAEIDADGTLAVIDGASFAARGVTNRGAVLVNSATLHSTAQLLNDGTLGATDATLRVDGGLDNLGAMRLADTRIIGDVYNETEIVLAGRNVFTGALSGNGVYTGKGSAVLEGSLNPGNSPGLTLFGGDVEFGDEHTLTIELAGLSPGTLYDRVQVAGELTLGGTLEVELLDGYAPAAGDVFDIAIAAFIQGDFAERLLPTLATGLRWHSLQLSDALGRDLYRLEVSAVPLPPAAWLLTSACTLILVRVRRR